MNVTGYWEAARNFRTDNPEIRHRGRVALLALALSDGGSLGQRAADALRSEGLIVVRDTYTLGAAV